jgi:hypothetical protein
VCKHPPQKKHNIELQLRKEAARISLDSLLTQREMLISVLTKQILQGAQKCEVQNSENYKQYHTIKMLQLWHYILDSCKYALGIIHRMELKYEKVCEFSLTVKKICCLHMCT